MVRMGCRIQTIRGKRSAAGLAHPAKQTRSVAERRAGNGTREARYCPFGRQALPALRAGGDASSGLKAATLPSVNSSTSFLLGNIRPPIGQTSRARVACRHGTVATTKHVVVGRTTDGKLFRLLTRLFSISCRTRHHKCTRGLPELPLSCLTDASAAGDEKRPRCSRCEQADQQCVRESRRRWRHFNAPYRSVKEQRWLPIPPQSASSSRP